MAEKDAGCIVQRDMLPRVIGYRFLREWLVLAEEFVNERKDWNNKTLAAILGCTLEGEVHDVFRALTNNGDVEGWSDVWAKMLELESSKGSFGYMTYEEPQAVNLECPDCHGKFEQLEAYEKHRTEEHQDEGVVVHGQVVVEEDDEDEEAQGHMEHEHEHEHEDESHSDVEDSRHGLNGIEEDRPEEENWVKDFDEVERKRLESN